MTDSATAFLAGERPDDVAIYLSAAVVDDLEKLDGFGDRVDDGLLLIVDGERGRRVFNTAAGVDAMAFAKQAMGTEGEIHDELIGGSCPERGENEDDHDTQFVFAFAEAQNEEVGGLYAEGNVIHAYARCECGTAYSEKWVAETR